MIPPPPAPITAPPPAPVVLPPPPPVTPKGKPIPSHGMPCFHRHHCVCCGNRLKEFFGEPVLLECIVCKEQFTPSISECKRFYVLKWERRVPRPGEDGDDIPF